MPTPKPLSQFLPHSFANGVSVRRFSKSCPHCGQILETSHMRGLMAEKSGRLYIAAHARCTHCTHVFTIRCVISDRRRVVKLPFSASATKWWIRRILRQQATIALNNHINTAQPTIEKPKIPSLSANDVALSEKVAGYLGSLSIPEWFEHKNKRYYFERTTQVEITKLQPNESLYCDKLIYKHHPQYAGQFGITEGNPSQISNELSTAKMQQDEAEKVDLEVAP